ncbi:DUF2490 domain-containing protein [Chryseolinea sp. T2]|uniref:DUF2490 domain-containing protein n=1 Tax=Chryseolinea sp. T2 TaxID=3129255 RepID=UPI003077F275
MFAQEPYRPTIAWNLPGFMYQASPKVKVMAQYGISTQRMQVVYPQVFITLNKYVTLNPAYLFIDFGNAGGYHYQEHTTMNSIILTVPVGKFLIEDRNMIWNRFGNTGEDSHFYRNRLRFSHPLSPGTNAPRLYIYNEASYYFGAGKWVRNRIAIGLETSVTRWFFIDLSMLRQYDRYEGQSNVLFLMWLFQPWHSRKRV